MRALEKLFRKNKKLVVGLMSGTSADGIDAVLVEITGSGLRSRIHQLAFHTYSYPRGFKHFLLQNSNAATARLDDVTRLNMLIAQLFADAVKNIVRKSGRRMIDIDLIGSHGQTIQHLPNTRAMFGKAIRATLQIGSPSAIAKLTGIVTVGDFRTADVAAGGSGAPLIPLFDFLMFRSRTRNRAALNIGGIANMTVIPKNCPIDNVVAFDTGPGNMIIDTLMNKFYGKQFDSDGMTASRGKILPSLLHRMMRHPYFQIKPPKSTGRELFGHQFIREIVQQGKKNMKEDLVTTAAELTALSIYQGYLDFVRRRTRFDDLFVSGGGSHNTYLMNALRRYFAPVNVRTTDDLRLSSDAKEAICFAMLANETVAGNPGNIPNATGARKQTVLGTIALP